MAAAYRGRVCRGTGFKAGLAIARPLPCCRAEKMRQAPGEGILYVVISMLLAGALEPIPRIADGP
jgi:hypothetical protein